MAAAEPLIFRYWFTWENGREEQVEVRLDPKSLNLIQPKPESLPEWTRLEYQKCPNCPLSSAQAPHCPAAVSLIDVVKRFGKNVSHERVVVRVEAPERQYAKPVPLQEGVSALIGIYMVTSGCPVMARLKPMVRYHLPFANMEETRYRALSMYLLAQYLLAKQGRVADWEAKDFPRMYAEIQKVNAHFFQRLAKSDVEDASLNAIVRLDAMADSISFTINQQILDELVELFQAYLR